MTEFGFGRGFDIINHMVWSRRYTDDAGIHGLMYRAGITQKTIAENFDVGSYGREGLLSAVISRRRARQDKHVPTVAQIERFMDGDRTRINREMRRVIRGCKKTEDIASAFRYVAEVILEWHSEAVPHEWEGRDTRTAVPGGCSSTVTTGGIMFNDGMIIRSMHDLITYLPANRSVAECAEKNGITPAVVARNMDTDDDCWNNCMTEILMSGRMRENVRDAITGCNISRGLAMLAEREFPPSPSRMMEFVGSDGAGISDTIIRRIEDYSTMDELHDGLLGGIPREIFRRYVRMMVLPWMGARFGADEDDDAEYCVRTVKTAHAGCHVQPAADSMIHNDVQTISTVNMAW